MDAINTIWGPIPDEKPMDVEALAEELYDAWRGPAADELAVMPPPFVQSGWRREPFMAVARRALKLLAPESKAK